MRGASITAAVDKFQLGLQVTDEIARIVAKGPQLLDRDTSPKADMSLVSQSHKSVVIRAVT